MKLFQPPNPDAPVQTNPDGSPLPPVIDTKKRLVSEFYDEIVFYEPSALMQQMLNTVQPATSGSFSHDTDCELIIIYNSIKFDFIFHFLVEEKKIKSLQHILDTRTKVKAEIAQLKEKLQETRDKITDYKKVMSALNPQA